MRDTAIVMFDDGRGRFGPMTDRRPAFALRSGAWTNRQRIEHTLRRTIDGALVPDRLRDVCATREPALLVNDLAPLGDRPVLLINGRWPAVGVSWDTLAHSHAWLVNDELLAARCSATAVQEWWHGPRTGVPSGCSAVGLEPTNDAALYARPWHLLDHLDRVLTHDLLALDMPTHNAPPDPSIITLGPHRVRIHPSARVFPHVVFNAEAGPIVIDAHAVIQPFTVIEGPAYVGPHSELAAHTALRSTTVIGPMCKVGGEVKASILTGYSNKAHLGYLGNAIIGAWCNLGADTNVSNLKNTYGPVRMQLTQDTPAEDTGRTFQGPLLGDFVKTGIGTRLVTGSCIGTGCSIVLSTYAPKFAQPLGFYTDQGRQPYDMDAFFDTADAVLQRRQKHLSPADRNLLRSLQP